MEAIRVKRCNFWQLTAILAPGFGLPGLNVSLDLSRTYGVLTTVFSIVLGNFILWFIALAVFSMSAKKNNAIENIRNYLGKPTTFFISLIWIFSFFLWYIIQLDAVNEMFRQVFQEMKGLPIIFTIVFGLFVTFIASRGISSIKKYCSVLLLFIIISDLIFLFTKGYFSGHDYQWKPPIYGTVSIVLIWFPLTINLPTILQYSKSKSHSVLSISIMSILHSLFQVSPLFLPPGLLSQNNFLVIFFILATASIINILNLFIPSAAIKNIFPKSPEKRNILLMGIMCTLFSAVAQMYSFNLSGLLIERILASVIATLGVVLVADFLLKLVVHHRPRAYEQFWSAISWMVGSATVLVMSFRPTSSSLIPVIFGMATSLLVFLLILFVEESLWATRGVLKKINKVK